jgi:hypothetical protein
MTSINAEISLRECTDWSIRAACIVALLFAAFGCAAPDIPLQGGTGAVISPAADGPFFPCEVTIQKLVEVDPSVDPIPELSVLTYLPQANLTPACDSVVSPNRPLALIYHALGQGPEDYDPLARRLASHGFVVANLEHMDNLSEVIPFLDEELGVFLSDNVALIGHSAGGELMIDRRSQAQQAGKTVRAMVLMAPRVQGDLIIPRYSLSGVDAFLGLHWTRDNDSATWGAPSPANGGVRRSVFRIYDRAGVDFDDTQSLSLSKHFVFFDFGGHNNQNVPGVMAYTTSFLRRYVLGDITQDRFLKDMMPPQTLQGVNRPILQQHEEPDRILLADFEESGDVPAAFDGLFTEGVSAFPPAIFAFSDPFSPHDLGVLRFSFDAKTEPEHKLSILLTDPGVETNGMTHLSFRIAQEYDPGRMQSRESLSFRVGIASGGDRFVDISDYGALPFPVLAQNVTIAQTGQVVDATKNAMRTYRIPLADFEIRNPGIIQGVTFDFSNTGSVRGERLNLVIDQVQLTR